jgi:hypothetical protein
MCVDPLAVGGQMAIRVAGQNGTATRIRAN